MTHCPAHEDRRPSLGVDERGGRILVICRAGCRQAEVLAALRARGLWPDSGRAQRPRGRCSPLEEAHAQVLAKAKRQVWARPGVIERYRDADMFRVMERVIDGARRIATGLGPDDPRSWDFLGMAAGLEREKLVMEAVAI